MPGKFFVTGTDTNIGKTVLFLNTPQESSTGTLTDLANALKGGQINTLVILGGNPVYNAPADLNWKTVQRQAQNVVRLGYYEDETFSVTDWHFPMAHYLESWGDGRTSDGTVVSIQPLIAPLFGGVTELEILATFAGVTSTRPYDIVRETFGGLPGGDASDNAPCHCRDKGDANDEDNDPVEWLGDTDEMVELLGRCGPLQRHGAKCPLRGVAH